VHKRDKERKSGITSQYKSTCVTRAVGEGREGETIYSNGGTGLAEDKANIETEKNREIVGKSECRKEEEKEKDIDQEKK
jgi:hypothetical protein